MGVDEGLKERIIEVYEETRSRVRVNKEAGKKFWTARGLRQGCPLSPCLQCLSFGPGGDDEKGRGWKSGSRKGEAVCAVVHR